MEVEVSAGSSNAAAARAAGAAEAAAGTLEAGGGVVAPPRRGTLEHTVPTASNADVMHATRLRLDYILTDHIATAAGTTCHVQRGTAAERMSDHFAVLCDNVCLVDTVPGSDSSRRRKKDTGPVTITT